MLKPVWLKFRDLFPVGKEPFLIFGRSKVAVLTSENMQILLAAYQKLTLQKVSQ